MRTYSTERMRFSSYIITQHHSSDLDQVSKSHRHAAEGHDSIIPIDSFLVQPSPSIIGDGERTKKILFRNFLRANSCLLLHYSTNQLREAVIIIVFRYNISQFGVLKEPNVLRCPL